MEERFVTETEYYAEQRAHEQTTAVFDWQELAEHLDEIAQLRAEWDEEMRARRLDGP